VYELDLTAIGNRIKQQREFLGFTREFMAEQLSKSINFCRDIEIGAKGMSLQTLANISRTLKLSLDNIVFGTSPSGDVEPLVLMLESCNPEKRKYVEEIVKTLLLAIE